MTDQTLTEREILLEAVRAKGWPEATLSGDEIVTRDGSMHYGWGARSPKKIASVLKQNRRTDAATAKFGHGQYVLDVTSSKNADFGGKKPYLCEILRDGSRRWADKGKIGAAGHDRFLLDAAPGQVFECRAKIWDGQSFEGGVFWFTVTAEGELAGLTRDDALRIATAEDRSVPVAASPNVLVPGAVRIGER